MHVYSLHHQGDCMRLSLNKAIPILSAITILASCQTNRYLNDAQTERGEDRYERDVAQVPPTKPSQQPAEYLASQSFDMLSQYTPHKYEILFTDPVCGVYEYKKDANVVSQSGKKLKQKPENVYCKNLYDLKRSGDQLTSPQNKLVSWINDSSVTEIFFTYLSFSNRAVKNALCEAAKRGVKIQFVLDSAESNDQTRADELIACNPNTVEKRLRGGNMGQDLAKQDKIGLAHNKFFIMNPNTPGEFKVVFSSGNMTSGPVIHHENWNFVTTNSQSQFAQAHLCAMKAEWNDKTGGSRAAYIEAIRSCRSQIKTPVEKDIKVFFVPGEGEYEKGVTPAGIKTASDYMIKGDGKFAGIETAGKIWIGAHRFLYNKMLQALTKRMQSSKGKPEMRIVADDDTYYVGKGQVGGDVMASEYFNIQKLVDRGAEAKYMETNVTERQLHHSKYLIFADKKGQFSSVFTGSANLTGAAFRTNWENSYFIAIPEVVQQFADHYVKMWDTMATRPDNLPKDSDVSLQLNEKPIINGVDSN
jgi:hypothetical protein